MKIMTHVIWTASVRKYHNKNILEKTTYKECIVLGYNYALIKHYGS